VSLKFLFTRSFCRNDDEDTAAFPSFLEEKISSEGVVLPPKENMYSFFTSKYLILDLNFAKLKARGRADVMNHHSNFPESSPWTRPSTCCQRIFAVRLDLLGSIGSQVARGT